MSSFGGATARRVTFYPITSWLRSPLAGAAAAREVAGSVDESDVREGLWKVAEHTARDGIVLLGEESDVVPDDEETLEESTRLGMPALEREVVSEPERARQNRTPPRRSGSEGVTAATMPPVGAYVSAFRVMSDRMTASRHSPSYVQRSDHSRHQASVSRMAVDGLGADGSGLDDAHHVRANGTCCPSETLNSATVRASSPRNGTDARSRSAFAPPTAQIPSAVRRTHGKRERNRAGSPARLACRRRPARPRRCARGAMSVRAPA